MIPVYTGCISVQLTSVHLGQSALAEGVIHVSFSGIKCSEKRDNPSFSLQTIGFVCLNFLLSSLGLQAAKFLALTQSHQTAGSEDVHEGRV